MTTSSGSTSGRSAEMGWKLASLLAGILATRVALLVVDGMWKKTVGGEPPTNPKAAQTTWGEAIMWAAVSGATIGIFRTVSQQSAAGVWERATGSLPPGLEAGAER